MFAYLGKEGFCVAVELRNGSAHCQNGTPAFLRRVIQESKKITSNPLLVRMDSGHHSRENLLELDPTAIDALYCAHGTSEQFHSEIKTDMDLERLPSGKMDTNALLLNLGIFAYNVLRMIGQKSLEMQSPLRKKAQRRRIRTVIQNMITIAARLIHHARRTVLGFTEGNPWFFPLKEIYTAIG